MRQAVFLSTGIGNALLMIPLVKALKERGSVSAICTSAYNPEEVFEGFSEPLFDRFIQLKDLKQYARHITFGRRAFDKVYLDHFSTSRKQSWLALHMGKKVYAIQKPGSNPRSLEHKRVTLISPKEGIHEAAQCMRLDNPNLNATSLQESHFEMRAISVTDGLERPYITIQPGAGNGNTPWKTLPIATWGAVLVQMLERCPDHHFIVLGDDKEKAVAEALPQHKRIRYAFDHYPLQVLPQLMAGASLHLGGDSALMHLAGCLGVPTVTVWGGSDHVMYGWNHIESQKHVVIHTAMPCAPCSRWLNPNMSRVSDPSACPDFACIRSVTSESIVAEAITLLKRW